MCLLHFTCLFESKHSKVAAIAVAANAVASGAQVCVSVYELCTRYTRFACVLHINVFLLFFFHICVQVAHVVAVAVVVVFIRLLHAHSLARIWRVYIYTKLYYYVSIYIFIWTYACMYVCECG